VVLLIAFSEVRKMRKEVELFKTYYLTYTNSYRSIEESETREHDLPPEGRRRSASKEEEYLINGSQSLSNRDQS
jgi:F0F1-type ATP synthase gamma subunit